MNQKKPTIIEEIAFLSVKYNVYLAELFQALVSARQKEKSTCTDLTVQYRGSTEDKAIFLITKDNKVLVQFRVPEEFLLTREIRFETWMNTDKIRRLMFKQNLGSNLSTMVQDLRHGMKRVSVEAKVLESPKPSLVFTRYGTSASVTNAWIADETGKIRLCLWNDQGSSFGKGDIIQIKNASVSTFREERQLSLGKTGTISVLQSWTKGTKRESELTTIRRVPT